MPPTPTLNQPLMYTTGLHDQLIIRVQGFRSRLTMSSRKSPNVSPLSVSSSLTLWDQLKGQPMGRYNSTGGNQC